MKTTTQPRGTDSVMTNVLSYGVIFNGLFFIGLTLLAEIPLPGHETLQIMRSGPALVAGLTFLYLGTLLRRRKRTAWLVTILIYALWGAAYLTTSAVFWLRHHHHHAAAPIIIALNILMPAAIVAGLVVYRKQFTAKSDIRNFAIALRFSGSILAVALVYGVAGFLLMDKHDFHQEIGLQEALHRTIDQFGVTTAHGLIAYTRRARLFQQSLSIVSIGAVAYAFVSLFQPLRARFGDQAAGRTHAQSLLARHPASSEDFFKLWPHDKIYFFDETARAGLAYSVHRGVALVAGDPLGDPVKFGALFDEFDELCRTNDWQLAFVHTEPQHNDWYKTHGFSLQKIGEEAILDLAHFKAQVRTNKYFRHIRNKFEKQGYTVELLRSPFDSITTARLRIISRNWLALPGRAERGFMMGYFSSDYLQQCPAVMVLRDSRGTIQAFMNQIPSYDKREANFDMLRHTQASLGNSNDFLLLNFIDYVSEQGYVRLNLGLCPLSGLGARDESHALIDNALDFVYNNGDRFYSFSGLRRFKAKYEPEWSPRYIAYREGVPGFTRTVAALTRAMKV